MSVECLRCGGVAVFCDFEAAAHFRSRGRSTAADDAIKLFRCRCGSRDVRFRPVPIHKRPRSIPPHPAALRAIYREGGRSLRRRGPMPFADQSATEAALETLDRAISARRYGGETAPEHEAAAALTALRPYCYEVAALDGFAAELDAIGKLHGGHADTVLTRIRRQLGISG